MLLLKGIIFSTLCSFASFLVHMVISFFRKGRLKGELAIFELTRQAKLLFFIWFILFLFYVILFFTPLGKIDCVIDNLGSLKLSGFLYGIIFYLILSFIYLTIYYLVDRSVSATILEIIYGSPDKKLTLEEIKDIYTAEKKYQKELQGMIEGGFIIKESDCYRNSLKASLYAKMARLMKNILKLGPGG